MAWSNWRGILVLTVLASVGLAWSQTPTNKGQTSASERIMTVHENGKALRCHVLQTWRTANGALAHQLQVIETGELMTIIEDGPTTPMTTSNGSRVAARPMRIFHWGQRRTAPVGCPTPPMIASAPGQGVTTAGAASSVATPESVRTMPLTSVEGGYNSVGSRRSQRVVSAPDTQERIIAWEEKTGKPVTLRSGPVGVDGNSVVSVPDNVITAQPGVVSSPSGRPLPRLIGMRNEPVVVSERVVSSQPATQNGVRQIGSATPGTGTGTPYAGGSKMPTISSSPGSQFAQTGSTVSSKIVSAPSGSPTASVPAIPSVSGQPLSPDGMSPPQPRQTLPVRTVPPSSGTNTDETGPTVAGTASGGVNKTAKTDEKKGPAVKLTMREKINKLFTKSPTKPAEPRPAQTAQNTSKPSQLPAPSAPAKKDDRSSTTAQAKKDDRTPASLPAPTTSGAKEPSGSVIAKNDRAKPAPTIEDKTPFTTATNVTTAPPKVNSLAIPPVDPARPASSPGGPTANAVRPGAPKPEIYDWRSMWGKSTDNVDQPGQSTVDRQLAKSGPKKQDILFSPEKFNPQNEKVNPNVTPQMSGLKPQQPELQPVSTLPPKLAGTSVPSGTTPAAMASLPTPLGVQSVLSARNGVQGPVQYIPVPVATVPEPIRPPTPPEPKMPEPPNPAMYVNAFTPPPGSQGQAPMMPQGMMPPQGMMAQGMMPPPHMMPWGPMPNRMAANTAYLVPVGNGMPMNVSYPANYGGPMPPNPFAQQQAFQGIQQVGYQALPQNGAYVNPAMDRRVVPAAAQQPVANDANSVGQLIKVLQESPYPAQREWAAANLSTFDWRVYPHLPQVLVLAARQDSVASVRAASVYGLSRMNIPSEPVLSTLQALRGDADPRVRQEVEQAFLRMGINPMQQ